MAAFFMGSDSPTTTTFTHAAKKILRLSGEIQPEVVIAAHLSNDNLRLGGPFSGRAGNKIATFMTGNEFNYR